MVGTRWKPLLRNIVGEVHREIRVSLASVPKPEKWLFVVGCYNSGTTLLSEILAEHSNIASLPTEGHFLTDQLPSEYDMGISRMWMMREDLFRLNEKDEGPDVIRLKKEWGMRLKNRDKPILLEKSPQNGARMRWLQHNFDNAYFIAIIRNPYAVAEGISRKAKPESRMGKWPIETSVTQWCRSNQVVEEDSKHLRHFNWVRYEDLAADPERELKKIYDFIGVEQPTSVNLNSEWSIHERNQVIRNLNEESIARLTVHDIETINRVAGDCMQHFQYKLATRDH